MLKKPAGLSSAFGQANETDRIDEIDQIDQIDQIDPKSGFAAC
jgi:hypothetical protein